MSSEKEFEKLTDAELLEMLKEHELSDEAIAAIAGGGNVKYFECVREKLEKKDGRIRTMRVIRHECRHLK